MRNAYKNPESSTHNSMLSSRFEKQNKKKKKKNSCRDWSSELCCSHKKVVEPMGKTSLVLDMVDVQEHDSG